MSPTTDTLPITIDVLLGPGEWNAGLRSDMWTDPAGDFALTLAVL